MFDYLFSQYQEYSTINIFLEIIAILFGIASVLFAKKNNILVFPTGIVSTFIFVYLLYEWGLIGDMIINIYYTTMSVYGWFLWSKKDNVEELPITLTSKKEWINGIFIFITTMVFVVLVYKFFNKFTHWTAYVDTLTTGIFFVGMWLMANRKIENWILWIVGDVISIPLYFYKGYTFTSLQYLLFTIIAVYGYIEWKKILQQKSN